VLVETPGHAQKFRAEVQGLKPEGLNNPGRRIPADHWLQIYTWMDATLRELSDLIKEVRCGVLRFARRSSVPVGAEGSSSSSSTHVTCH
jgi:hypothetical protein